MANEDYPGPLFGLRKDRNLICTKRGCSYWNETHVTFHYASCKALQWETGNQIVQRIGVSIYNPSTYVVRPAIQFWGLYESLNEPMHPFAMNKFKTCRAHHDWTDVESILYHIAGLITTECRFHAKLKSNNTTTCRRNYDSRKSKWNYRPINRITSSWRTHEHAKTYVIVVPNVCQ